MSIQVFAITTLENDLFQTHVWSCHFSLNVLQQVSSTHGRELRHSTQAIRARAQAHNSGILSSTHSHSTHPAPNYQSPAWSYSLGSPFLFPLLETSLLRITRIHHCPHLFSLFTLFTRLLHYDFKRQTCFCRLLHLLGCRVYILFIFISGSYHCV